MWEQRTFSIDGLYENIPGWTQGERWNGFATPFFEREAADKIMTATNAADDFEGSGRFTYDTTADTFVHQWEGLDEPDVFDPMTIDTPNGPVKVWGIGAFGWTWTDETTFGKESE